MSLSSGYDSSVVHQQQKSFSQAITESGNVPRSQFTIHVIRFWRLNQGFQLISCFSAQKWVWKVRFYKPCTSAESEKWVRSHEQDTAREREWASSSSIKVTKIRRLSIGRLFSLSSLHGSLRCCEIDPRERPRHFLSYNCSSILMLPQCVLYKLFSWMWLTAASYDKNLFTFMKDVMERNRDQGRGTSQPRFLRMHKQKTRKNYPIL